MGALPKRKVSPRRRDNRRRHMKLVPPQLSPCPSCRALIPQYQACPNCGQYRGRQVLRVRQRASAGS